MSERDRMTPTNDWVDTSAGSSPDPAEGKGPLRGLPPFPDLLTGNDAEGVDPESGSPAGVAGDETAARTQAYAGPDEARVGEAEAGEVQHARRPTTER
jgi:hypothetical protein